MTGDPATSWEELATNRGAAASSLRDLAPSRWALATSRELAGPTPQGGAARARQEVAARAKRLPAQATGTVWPRGPLELEGLQVPRVRPLNQPITSLRAGPEPRQACRRPGYRPGPAYRLGPVAPGYWPAAERTSSVAYRTASGERATSARASEGLHGSR